MPRTPRAVRVPERFYARVNRARAALLIAGPGASNKKLVSLALKFIAALQDLDREEQILKHKEAIF